MWSELFVSPVSLHHDHDTDLILYRSRPLSDWSHTFYTASLTTQFHCHHFIFIIIIIDKFSFRIARLLQMLFYQLSTAEKNVQILQFWSPLTLLTNKTKTAVMVSGECMCIKDFKIASFIPHLSSLFHNVIYYLLVLSFLQ